MLCRVIKYSLIYKNKLYRVGDIVELDEVEASKLNNVQLIVNSNENLLPTSLKDNFEELPIKKKRGRPRLKPNFNVI